MSEFDWRQIAGGGGRPQGPPLEIDPPTLFKRAYQVLFALLLVWAGFDAYFTVEANEEAVVLRFGAYHLTAGPGFHGKLPFGIDRVLKAEVKTVHRAEFGYRTLASGVKSQFDYTSKDVVAEATMLTGDLNISIVSWEVRYKIRDLKDYLFEVRKPVETLRAVSEAVMRSEVGDRSIDEVLTLDRTVIENTVTEKLQKELDLFKCGLQIVTVNLKRVDPPDGVRDAFNAVNQAIQIRDRIINEAEGTRNKKIPAARGAKDRAVKEAEGYKIGRRNRAVGETEAFLSVLAAYHKAEDITRRRLYLESMARALPRAGNITLIDDPEGGVLKLLNLDETRPGRQGVQK